VSEFTNEELKEISAAFNGFHSDELKNIGKKAQDELNRRAELENLDFDDCESCKL